MVGFLKHCTHIPSIQESCSRWGIGFRVNPHQDHLGKCIPQDPSSLPEVWYWSSQDVMGGICISHPFRTHTYTYTQHTQECMLKYIYTCCMHSHFSHVWLCGPVDGSPPGSSVHGIFQARILEWVAISSSRDLPNPGLEPVSLAYPVLADRFFTTQPSWKSLLCIS